MEATEMKMLRWFGGIRLYLHEHRMNDDIRRFMNIASITERARAARLRWYGHVMRREPDHMLKAVWNTTVERRRSRGRQRIRPKDVVDRDMREVGARANEWLNRARWKKRCRAADPTGVDEG